jgi:F-type H+-transporting ATPase subunit gamma
MGGQQRVYNQKIRSTQTLKKMFRAMELIAASRISKARERAGNAAPYARAITRAVSAVATHATVLREAERLRGSLRAEGKEVDLYIAGRRGVSFYTFRHIPIVQSWTGSSDNPSAETAEDIADTLVQAFSAPAEAGGVSEIHVVYTRFRSMVTQEPRVVRMLPLEVVEGVAEPGEGLPPLYEFEPGEAEVLDALLPRYIRSRIFNALLQAAASELAARQRAMRAAVDNAEELIRNYTRLKNTARQAEITQEISEIVSGADALAAS